MLSVKIEHKICIREGHKQNLATHNIGQSGKSGTIQESNKASGVRKAHYAYYYVRKSHILLAGSGVRKISVVASGFSPIKIHFFYSPEKFNPQNNIVYVFFSIRYIAFTVCFAAITRVIVLAWFMGRRRHVM